MDASGESLAKTPLLLSLLSEENQKIIKEYEKIIHLQKLPANGAGK